MLVDPEDGRCRTCKTGTLTIVDADDVSMTVECDECGDTYDVETDAFNDGCLKYYFTYMLARQEGEDEGE